MKKFIITCALFLISPLALSYSCDTPAPYCKEMSSCEEAKFYLNQCGIGKLDRDSDGIPCENVCGKKGKSKSKKKGGKKSGKSKTKSKKMPN